MTTATTTNTITDPVTSSPSPIVTETNTMVTSPVVEGSGGTPQPTAAPTPTPEPTPAPTTDPATNTPEWAQKRINELTAKRYEAERDAQTNKDARIAAEHRAAELLKQIEKGGTPQPTPAPTPAPQMTETEIERRANEKATQIAAANRFNEACNNIVEIGKKDFAADWDQAVKNLGMVGAIGKDVSPEFLETAIELKNPAKILHYLGTHMDEGARIAALPGKRMAMELARIEAQLSAPPPAPTPAPLSNAPAPVIPVGGASKPGTPAIDDPNLESAEWYKLREQQVMEKRNRYQRP